MQPPPPTGTTGSAPPLPVGPPGLVGGAGAWLDIAFVAVVSGASALAPAPTTAAPHPTIKTNRPALARSATCDLPTFVIIVKCRRRAPDAHKRSTQACRAPMQLAGASQ
jgi:hypothetical protein